MTEHVHRNVGRRTGSRRSGLIDRLEGGDRRSIGAADQVVERVLDEPRAGIAEIIAGMTDPDRRVRMRAADVAEKVSARLPSCLQPHKSLLVAMAGRAQEPELRWHLAQMLPRLSLDTAERRRVEAILFGYLADDSRIVRTFALQALADLTRESAELLARLLPVLRDVVVRDSPAVQARARHLLEDLG